MASTSGSSAPAEELDDLIGLLNTGAEAKAAQARQQQDEEEQRRRAAAEAAEQERRKREAEQEEAERQRREREAAEAEARRRQEEERRRQEEERRRLQQQREEEERRRKQQEEARAEAERRAREEEAARKAIEEQRQCNAATCLQSAVRALFARRLLRRDAALSAIARQQAARRIQRCWRAWAVTRGWDLGQLRVPVRGTRPSSGLKADHLLELPLRLRAAADARLAPDGSGEGEAVDDAAGHHRTVVATKALSTEAGALEAQRRAEVGARTAMAASEHRDTAAALAVAVGRCTSARVYSSLSRNSSTNTRTSSSGQH